MPPTIYFRVPLTCTNCGSLNDARTIQLYSSGLGSEPTNTNVDPGEAIELEDDDFDVTYLAVHPDRPAGATFSAIELWGCQVCHRLRAARIEFRRRTPQIVELVGATVVQMSSEVLDEARYVTRRLDEWAPLPGDDVEQLAELEARAK